MVILDEWGREGVPRVNAFNDGGDYGHGFNWIAKNYYQHHWCV